MRIDRVLQHIWAMRGSQTTIWDVLASDRSIAHPAGEESSHDDFAHLEFRKGLGRMTGDPVGLGWEGRQWRDDNVEEDKSLQAGNRMRI